MHRVKPERLTNGLQLSQPENAELEALPGLSSSKPLDSGFHVTASYPHSGALRPHHEVGHTEGLSHTDKKHGVMEQRVSVILSLGDGSASCTVGRAVAPTCPIPASSSLVFVLWHLKDSSELVSHFPAFSGGEVLFHSLGQSEFSLFQVGKYVFGNKSL